jgi:hypothetical protein
VETDTKLFAKVGAKKQKKLEEKAARKAQREVSQISILSYPLTACC